MTISAFLIINPHTKSHTSWNKGKKFPQYSGENSPRWKGDKVSYTALHDWLNRNLGRANHCENKDCVYPKTDTQGRTLLKPKIFTWANISGKYKRDLSDWHQLCNSCNGRDGISKPERFKK